MLFLCYNLVFSFITILRFIPAPEIPTTEGKSNL